MTLPSPLNFWGHVHSNPDTLIWVSVWRIRVEFSRPHEYATAIYICLSIASRDVPSLWRSWCQAPNPSDPKFTLESGFKNMCFRCADSLVSCGRKAYSYKKGCGLKSIGIRFLMNLLTCTCPLNYRHHSRRLSFYLKRESYLPRRRQMRQQSMSTRLRMPALLWLLYLSM